VNRIDLVIGLSEPICQYNFPISRDDQSEEQRDFALSPFQNSGMKKSRPGNIFVTITVCWFHTLYLPQSFDPFFASHLLRLQDSDAMSLQNLSIPKWSWLSRRNQSHHLRRSVSDKFMEVLLSAVCETNRHDQAMSSLSSSCLSYLLQAELKASNLSHSPSLPSSLVIESSISQGRHMLLPNQILIFLASPFLASLDSLDDLTILISTLFPSFPAGEILRRFAEAICLEFLLRLYLISLINLPQ
jgi:hypothetical protein